MWCVCVYVCVGGGPNRNQAQVGNTLRNAEAMLNVKLYGASSITLGSDSEMSNAAVIFLHIGTRVTASVEPCLKTGIGHSFGLQPPISNQRAWAQS